MNTRRFICETVARCMRPVTMLALAASAAAAQRAHFGTLGGVNFDSKEPFVGFQFTAPLASLVEFYPSVDVYLPDHGSAVGLNGDLKLRLPTGTPVQLYTGGGLNVMHRSASGVSNNDLGANFLFGLESRAGWIHPFLEGRALVHDNSSFQLQGGSNFTLPSR